MTRISMPLVKDVVYGQDDNEVHVYWTSSWVLASDVIIDSVGVRCFQQALYDATDKHLFSVLNDERLYLIKSGINAKLSYGAWSYRSMLR